MTGPETEIAAKARFDRIRYAQVWEDADILLEALEVTPQDRVLSIASAGDNCLSLLSKRPLSVDALDLSQAQLFCLEARVGAFQALNHSELLDLMGSRSADHNHRLALWKRVKARLSHPAIDFFEPLEPALGRLGLGGIGKFEAYFSLFRRYILPIMHNKDTVAELMTPKSEDARLSFFEQRFANHRFRALTRLFFSRTLMGLLGRDPAFFAYVNEPFSVHIQRRIRQGLTELEPAQNPYLHWILYGRHSLVLPHALREEQFLPIRDNLDRLSWHLHSVESFGAQLTEDRRFGAFNLSNIFEYMSQENFLATMQSIVSMASNGARFAYWNMMVPRRASDHMRALKHQKEASKALFAKDKAIFYRDFVLEHLTHEDPCRAS